MKNKISIIIPCYNNGFLLSKMVDCILQQTYTNWELLIIDDRSTDETHDIVREYVSRDKRISFFIRDREPKGAQTCRNIGMNKANGKFIVIFDADDLISKTCLEKRAELLENNPDIDYISFPAMPFKDENNLPTFYDKGIIYGVGTEETDVLSHLLKANYSLIVWTNIYKTASLINLRWDEKVKVYQDFDFAVSVVLSGLKHKFSNLKEIDYFYRFGHGNTISSNFVSDEKSDSTIYLFSKTLNLLKLRTDYKKRKKEFTHFILLHYEKLITDGNHIKINKYYSFCENFYSMSFTYRLKIIGNLALLFNHFVLRKLMFYLLSGILYCRKQSILMFCRILLHAFQRRMMF